MSSGFVSGGTIDEPTERDVEWRRAQQELEEERRRKAELGKQNDGKSLFEVLQQNKIAKQEAFEESIRLKNQFRALDEDEVEFLDSLLESTRAQEAAVKRETAQQLAEYQRQREEAERALIEAGSAGPAGSTTAAADPKGGDIEWTVAGKKRKRNKKDLLVPPKMRKSSSGTAEKTSTVSNSKETPAAATVKSATSPTSSASKVTPPRSNNNLCEDEMKSASIDDSLQNKRPEVQNPTLALGLVSYDSDEDSG